MIVSQLRDLLWSLHPALDKDLTVDQIIAGPDQEIRHAAVCWMPYSWAIKEAAARGANLLVAHEPTFYDHFEFRQGLDERYQGAKAEKERLIMELGITILRCHDVWDAVPESGVPDSWGRFLGLGAPVDSTIYHRLYKIERAGALEAAQRIAQKTKASGQSTLAFYGNPEAPVERIGIGTGCCSSPHELFALGADMVISVDDIIRSWIDGEWATDTGRPILVVNHGVSEACAMESLAAKVQELAPGIPTSVIHQGCSHLEVHAAAL